MEVEPNKPGGYPSGNYAYNRIRAALDAIGLTETYLEIFEQHKLNDTGVNVYVKFPSTQYIRKKLEEVIVNEEHRSLFVNEYKKSQFGSLLAAQDPCTSLTSISSDSLSSPSVASLQNPFYDDNSDVNETSQGPVDPLLIIEISSKLSGEAISHLERIKFYSENLEAVLLKSGNRPVALLSIVGPARQGKSFFLNYVIRYLRLISKQQQQQPSGADSHLDWMGLQSKSKRIQRQPLKGGFPWSNGRKQETKGIWIWPESFPLKDSHGTEFDVYLLDTQSIFDRHSEKEDWATILGLTILTSSCLLINISQNSISEDVLLTLKEFMEFGHLASAARHSSGDKFFQQLNFLVRDWIHEGDFPFGAEGGSSYFDSNFDVRPTSTSTLLRQQIKDSVQQLGCFLMPDPDSQVKGPEYTGSVLGMAPKFASHLQIFIETLFDLKNSMSKFGPKIVSGNTVTGKDFYLYFQQYVKMFNNNSGRLPNPKEMYDTTVLTCNQTVLNRCLDLYSQEMQPMVETITIQNQFIVDLQLQEFHEVAQKKALELFNILNKMGNANKLSQVETKLLQLIEKSYRLTKDNNTRKQNKSVSSALVELETIFQDLMEEKCASFSTGMDDFVSDGSFNEIYSECFIIAEEQVLCTLGLDSITLLSPEEQQHISAKFRALKESAELRNKIRKVEAEKQLKYFVKDLVSSYAVELNDEISKPSKALLSLEDLLQRDAALRYKYISTLCTKFSTSSLFLIGKRELVEGIWKGFKIAQSRVEIQH